MAGWLRGRENRSRVDGGVLDARIAIDAMVVDGADAETTDEAFSPFLPGGVAARSEMILSRDERDADPLGCTGESFGSEGTLSNWVVLE